MRGTQKRRTRMSLLGALALTSWLGASLGGFASPVHAKPCPTLALGPGLVSPWSGTTTTSYRFTVTVADKSGTAPSRVRVRVNGTSSDLAPGGTNLKAGVLFSGTRRLPAGTWPYSFQVRTGGATCSFTGVVPAAVIVSAPPTPKPAARPTPKPTPKPIPKAIAKPTPMPPAKPTPKSAKATPKPTSEPLSTDSPRPSTPTPEPASSGSPAAPSEPAATPTPVPSASSTPRPAIGGSPGGSGGGGSDPQLGFDATGLIAVVTNPLAAWLITTIGGVLLFLLLVRRPQSDDDGWSTGLILAVEPPGPVAAVEPPGPVAVHGSTAASRPAGLGPSPAATRTSGPPRAPRTFDRPAANGAERVKVGYRRVRISSKPDAVRSVERGRLEPGDEVEILESYEGFLRVETPDGISGWIQRHTVVGDSQG